MYKVGDKLLCVKDWNKAGSWNAYKYLAGKVYTITSIEGRGVYNISIYTGKDPFAWGELGIRDYFTPLIVQVILDV